MVGKSEDKSCDVRGATYCSGKPRKLSVANGADTTDRPVSN